MWTKTPDCTLATQGYFVAEEGAIVAVDCLSLPSRASNAAAPEEKESDELEAVSPTSPPDIPI